MDGQECKEVMMSQLAIDNEKFRLDDEFFLKKYLLTYKKIKSLPHTTMNDIIGCLTDFHANGSYENIAQNFELLNKKDYAYMVRSTDLEAKDYETNVKYVSEHTYNFLAKSKIFGGELLINKIGTPGRVYFMPKLEMPVSLGMNLFMVRLKHKCDVEEAFLWAFFNSKFGENIIKRKINGTVPLTIDKEAIKSLYIPKISKILQSLITKTVSNSQEYLKQSKSVYHSAELLLLNELNIADFTPSISTVAVKHFSESLGVSGRLDAEYYQPQYEALLTAITSQKHSELGKLVSIKKSIEPGSEAYQDTGIPFIRVSNITKFELTEPEIHLERSQYNIDALKPKKDTILLSKDGSVCIAYKVQEDLDVITSGALLHLEVIDNSVLPDYLTVVLNSFIIKLQAERDAGGSIIQHWKPTEIGQVVIPVLPIDKQKAIAEKIQKSFKIRAESINLLEKAKRAVEFAIEQGEEKAMELLS